jgi:hypothetical protein
MEQWVNIPSFVPTENKRLEQRKQTVLKHNKTHMHRFEYSRKNKGGKTCVFALDDPKKTFLLYH